MACADETIEEVLEEVIKKMEKFEKRVGSKIGILNAEQGGSRSAGFLGGGFGGLSVVGGVIGRLKNKVFNSLGGQIFQDIKTLFGEGFSLNRFVDLVMKHMVRIERRSRYERERFNPILIDAYDEYEELLFIINTDPNDLIFISKIGLEELDVEVEQKETLLDELTDLINTIESELANLDQTYYDQNNSENKILNFQKASDELLEAIMEIGEVDVAITSDRENFDSNSYVAAQNNVDAALQAITPASSFNDVVFKEGARSLASKVRDFKTKVADIVERKELLENFIPNFEENHTDNLVERFLLKEMIVEMRDIKEDIDSIIDKGGTFTDSFKEDILARIFAIKIRLVSTKQKIIDSINEVRDIDPGNDPENERENFNFYDDMVSSLGSITEDVTEDETELNEILATLDKEVFNVTRKETSDPVILQNALDDLKVIVNKHKLRREEYADVLDAYTPRENPQIELAMKLAKVQGYIDVVDAIKKGDWKKVFGLLSNGNLGLGDTQKRISCLLAETSLANTTTDVLRRANFILDSFENNVVQPFTNRKDAIEIATCDLERDKKRIKNAVSDLRVAIKVEKDRRRRS